MRASIWPLRNRPVKHVAESSLIKIPLKRDASGQEGCSDTSGMDLEFCIRQRSDYVTKVKDHRWASNWITLEFE